LKGKGEREREREKRGNKERERENIQLKADFSLSERVAKGDLGKTSTEIPLVFGVVAFSGTEEVESGSGRRRGKKREVRSGEGEKETVLDPY